jgi:hypothetical protein
LKGIQTEIAVTCNATKCFPRERSKSFSGSDPLVITGIGTQGKEIRHSEDVTDTHRHSLTQNTTFYSILHNFKHDLSVENFFLQMISLGATYKHMFEGFFVLSVQGKEGKCIKQQASEYDKAKNSDA